MKLYDLEIYKDCRIVANAEDDGFAIADIEPVEAVPVVHGKWISKWYRCFECSCCAYLFTDYVRSIGVWNYCPNCGAKMDEAVDDGKTEEAL